MILDNGRSNLLGTHYPGDAGVHPLRRLPQRLPRVPEVRWRCVRPCVLGPMGAVLLPLLVGLEEASSLPHASSLCGACSDACPVKIPLHELLLELRSDLVDRRRRVAWWERLAFDLWSLAWSSPLGYRLTTALGRLGSPLGGLVRAGPHVGEGQGAAANRAALPGRAMSLVDDFVRNAEAVGVTVHRGAAPEIEGAGVSPALYGLADTGSVVLAASAEEPRARSLLPDVHVVLLAEDRILPGLAGAVRSCRQRSSERARDRDRAEPERRHRAAARRRRARPGRGARRPDPAWSGHVRGTVPRTWRVRARPLGAQRVASVVAGSRAMRPPTVQRPPRTGFSTMYCTVA